MLDISHYTTNRWVGVTPPQVPFVIQRIAPKGMVTLLVAEGGVGKSMFMQQACTAVALNKPFLGLSNITGNTVGLFAEDPDVVLHERQARVMDSMRMDMEELSDRCFIIPQSDTDMRLWVDNRHTKALSELEAQLAQIPRLQLLTLDNVALLFSGDENSRIEVTGFMSHLNKMAARLDIAIILSTHSSKSNDGSSLRLASGSTAWINAARSVLELKKGSDDTVSLKLRKTNHAPAGEVAELTWKDGVLYRPEGESFLLASLRQKQTRSYILNEVQRRQDTEQPLSSSHQAVGRYLPDALRSQSAGKYKVSELNREMRHLLASGELISSKKNTRSSRGLRVADAASEKKHPAHAEMAIV